MQLLVARITDDHLNLRKGQVPFSYEGFERYWGWTFAWPDDVTNVTEAYLDYLPETKFRLYDDDEILYYSGWLKNDTDCMVQQFVLAWAMADSGCTIIKIFHPISNTWIQEI